MTFAPTLRGYRREMLAGDAVAGLTVAALVLPLGMALAVTAGLPAEAGLYGSMASLVAFALASASRRTMIGPDASVTALVVAGVLPLSDGGARHAALVAALCLLAGTLCLVATALRMGRLAGWLTHAALVGYLAGLAVVVAISQLPRLGGLDPVEDGRPLSQLAEVVRAGGDAHPWSVALGVGTAALVLVARAVRPTLPWMLAALGLATAITAACSLRSHGVAVVGSLPTGLPEVGLPEVGAADIVHLLPLALAVVVVTFADTLATSAAFAARHDEPHDAGRDLLGLGLADLASGLVGALPASASGARTAAAEGAGARSQATGLVAAATIAAVLAGAGELLAAMPLPALAGIVVAAVVPMVDVQSLARMRRLDRPRLWSALVVLAVVVAVGVIEGIAAAFLVSLADRFAGVRRSRERDRASG